MLRTLTVLLATAVIGCGRPPAGPVARPLALDRLARPALSLADPADPIGVAAAGSIVARLVVGSDTGYRLVDSTGKPGARVGVTGVGAWLAGDDGLFYTLSPAAAGIATVRQDGTTGPSFRLPWPGIVRGVVDDSIDLMRPGANGFAIVRVALAGGDSVGGERILLAEGLPEIAELLGVPSVGILGSGPGSPLPSTTTSLDRVVVGNGQSYRILVFSSAGQLIARIARDLDTMRLTKRQVENEIHQIQSSGQRLADSYLEILRLQLSRQRLPFFSHVQGLRYDRAGRLWVVGFEGDSVFADAFSDTTFVRRFSLGCYGFDGQWDLKGEVLVVSCGRQDPAASGGEVQVYRILGQ